MRTRTGVIFITVNVVVSLAVILIVLLFWDCTPSSPTPTATAVPPARTLSVTEEMTDVPTALPVASPPSAEPLLHIVREGDTLGGIAQAYDVSVEALIAVNNLVNPDVLAVGQTLVIPVDGVHTPTPISPAEAPTEPAPTPTPLSTVLPTLTPSGPPLVEIAQVLGSGDLATEVVIVRNRGGVANLEEWTLADAEGNTFTFPALILFTDVEVRLHSAAGSSTPRDLYWGRANPAWGGGELITLRDAAGDVVDTYIVP